MKKITLSPLSIIWLMAISYFNPQQLFPLFFAIALHELGHITLAKMQNVKIKRFKFSLLGAALETNGDISYKKELLIALGGPLFGALGSIVAFSTAKELVNAQGLQSSLEQFSIISLCLSMFNLIPLSSLDGAMILKCLLCQFFSLEIAVTVLRITSFFTLLCLWLFSVYFMLKLGAGLPMFVFCLFFFSKCFIFNNKNGDLKRF